MVTIRNVHLRVYPVPPERLAPLIDGLAGPDDRLWPHDRWPLHDALLEDALDRAAGAVLGTPVTPRPHSWWVRLLRSVFLRRRRGQHSRDDDQTGHER